MKKRQVQTITQDGNVLGQVSSPDDLMLAQDFAHARVSNLANDFINNVEDATVSGFPYTLPTSNTLQLTISRAGRVYTKDGTTYDLESDVTLTFDGADDTYSRIDLVVAALDDEVPENLTLTPFVRLRTTEEFGASTPPYPPQNISAATELHWTATPRIKTGTPGINPALPSLAANEVVLYLVTISPGATTIASSNIIDLRNTSLTLQQITDAITSQRGDLTTLAKRVSALENIGSVPVDTTEIYGEIRSILDIIKDLESRITPSADVPEIRYTRPKVDLTDPDSSKLSLSGDNVSGVPVLDIGLGALINFGDAEVSLEPQNFPSEYNARYVSVGSHPEHFRQDVAVTIANIIAGSTNGTVDLGERSAVFPSARSRSAVAARDSQHLEIFGGLAADNFTQLGDWWTYDILNDTLTQRTITGGLPSSGRCAMFPYGDGSGKTLLILNTGNGLTDATACYEVDPTGANVTWTAITGTLPTGIEYMGDLVSTGKIFVRATRHYSGGAGPGVGDQADFWDYDTATKTFTKVTVSGTLPQASWGFSDACYYTENQLLMLSYEDPSRAMTLLIDRTTLQSTELPVKAPLSDNYPTSRPGNFQMANVNGRPLVVGISNYALTPDGSNMPLWEFKLPAVRTDVSSPQLNISPQWFQENSTIPWIYGVGFASLLRGDGRAAGSGVVAGERGIFNTLGTKVYSTVSTGVAATTLNGVAGITLSDGSTFAAFELPAYTASWAVAAYLATINGSFNPGDVKMEVSFDSGAHWHTISNTTTFTVTDSDNPGHRRLRLTLYKSVNKPPIITGITEIMDQTGTVLEDRTVIRLDIPGAEGDPAKAFFVDRKGIVTAADAAEYSTSQKCLLFTVQYDTNTNPPGFRTFINRRRPHVRYEGTLGGPGTNVQVDLATPVRFYKVYGVVASGKHLYRAGVVDTTHFFNNICTLSGITSGDDWILEVEG